MRIEAEQRAVVTVALRPYGEVELDHGRRVPARSDSVDIEVGATVIVQSTDEHGLVVRLLGLSPVNPNLPRSKPMNKTTEQLERDYQKRDFKELVIPFLVFSVFPGVLMSLIFYSQSHDPLNAVIGFLIGAIALPVILVIAAVFNW